MANNEENDWSNNFFDDFSNSKSSEVTSHSFSNFSLNNNTHQKNNNKQENKYLLPQTSNSYLQNPSQDFFNFENKTADLNNNTNNKTLNSTENSNYSLNINKSTTTPILRPTFTSEAEFEITKNDNSEKDQKIHQIQNKKTTGKSKQKINVKRPFKDTLKSNTNIPETIYEKEEDFEYEENCTKVNLNKENSEILAQGKKALNFNNQNINVENEIVKEELGNNRFQK
jgi:hypothetical protein